jgi:hypothetical protein
MNAVLKHFVELHQVVPLLKPKAIPLDFGSVLSIHNNDFHPKLNAQGVETFDGAASYLAETLPHLLQLGVRLKEHPINTREFFLALNYLNSYVHILETTLQTPDNARLNAYHLNKKGGAK